MLHLLLLFSAVPNIYCASIHATEIQHPLAPADDTMTIHILEVQPLIKPDKHIEHATADSHTIHEIVHLIESNKNAITEEQELKVLPVIPLIHTEEKKDVPKVHQVVNLISNDEKDKIAIIKVEPKKVTLTAHDDDKKTSNEDVVKTREQKAYPVYQHVLIPTNIHTYYPVQHDLRVIPLSRESFRDRYNEYEPRIFPTYYGGFGNGLNFGGHGAGHGFYAYG